MSTVTRTEMRPGDRPRSCLGRIVLREVRSEALSRDGRGETERDHESVRAEYVDRMMQRGDESEERLFWPVQQRQATTNGRLAGFLEFTRERSPWHRARLDGIDLSAVTEQEISASPARVGSLSAYLDTRP